MSTLTHEQVLEVLRSGDADRRVSFARRLPASSMTNAALGLIGSDNPGMVVVGLSTMTQEYCMGRDPTVGTSK